MAPHRLSAPQRRSSRLAVVSVLPGTSKRRERAAASQRVVEVPRQRGPTRVEPGQIEAVVLRTPITNHTRQAVVVEPVAMGIREQGRAVPGPPVQVALAFPLLSREPLSSTVGAAAAVPTGRGL
jgi:hypothetical protein